MKSGGIMTTYGGMASFIARAKSLLGVNDDSHQDVSAGSTGDAASRPTRPDLRPPQRPAEPLSPESELPDPTDPNADLGEGERNTVFDPIPRGDGVMRGDEWSPDSRPPVGTGEGLRYPGDVSVDNGLDRSGGNGGEARPPHRNAIPPPPPSGSILPVIFRIAEAHVAYKIAETKEFVATPMGKLALGGAFALTAISVAGPLVVPMAIGAAAIYGACTLVAGTLKKPDDSA